MSVGRTSLSVAGLALTSRMTLVGRRPGCGRRGFGEELGRAAERLRVAKASARVVLVQVRRSGHGTAVGEKG